MKIHAYHGALQTIVWGVPGGEWAAEHRGALEQREGARAGINGGGGGNGGELRVCLFFSFCDYKVDLSSPSPLHLSAADPRRCRPPLSAVIMYCSSLASWSMLIADWRGNVLHERTARRGNERETGGNQHRELESLVSSVRS